MTERRGAACAASLICAEDSTEMRMIMKETIRESSNLTTLCYIEKDGRYLMMHRISKKNDANKGKWIGVGGHFIEGESPEECMIREVKEETGLKVTSFRFRGIVTFILRDWGCEYMHLFTVDGFEGDSENLPECSEGVLEWVPFDEIEKLNLWEGDRIFLRLLREDREFFSLKLEYDKDRLVESRLSLY